MPGTTQVRVPRDAPTGTGAPDPTVPVEVSGVSARRLRRYRHRMSVQFERQMYAHRMYQACGELTGPLVAPERVDEPVRFVRVGGAGRRVVLTLLVLVNLGTGLLFLGWLLLPSHIPGPGLADLAGWQSVAARVGFCLVVTVELVRVGQNVAVWVLAFKARDPVPWIPRPGMRVAMLTTIVPSKEPLEVVERTLVAMSRVRYAGRVDVWILDEGDDPRVKEMAARLGVYHFSRKGRPEFNEVSGPYRAKTKAGNHNAWRALYEHHYDVVAQMDPDHVPLPSFLERTLGFFRDPDVAFVVAPQVYGNMYSNWVSHGASVQQYLFSGVIERGGNGLAAPFLIGTNHLYRPEAWAQIGGYQDSIIEDHLTSMCVHAAANPATGAHWRGVYTPDVVAIGEGPASWTDYFNQQKRWAYGVWQILLRRRPYQGRLRRRQRLAYGLVQSYYPSVAAGLLLGNLATAGYMVLGIRSTVLQGTTWAELWGASMGSWLVLWLWLRRYNIAEHERREIGVAGMLLALFAAPMYAAAAVAAVLHRRLAYAVTAKGRLRSQDPARSFTLHVMWALAGIGLVVASVLYHHTSIALRTWTALAILAGSGPPLIALGTRIRNWWSGLPVPRQVEPAGAPAGEQPLPPGTPRVYGQPVGGPPRLPYPRVPDYATVTGHRSGTRRQGSARASVPAPYLGPTAAYPVVVPLGTVPEPTPDAPEQSPPHIPVPRTPGLYGVPR